MEKEPFVLSVLSYAHQFTLWHCKTEMDKMDFIREGHLNQYFDILSVGDIIFLNFKKSEVQKTSMLSVAEIKDEKVLLQDIT